MRRLRAAVPGRFRQRPGVLLVATLLVLVAGSFVTHLAAAGEPGSGIVAETGEIAERGAVLVPPMVGPIGALLLLGLVRLLRRRSLGPAWFLLLPPAAFGIQELTERLVHAGSLSLVGGEPSMPAALVFQVPFAILAFVLARLLRAAIRQVAGLLAVPRTTPALRAAVLAWPLPPLALPDRWTLAGAHSGRGPPHLF